MLDDGFAKVWVEGPKPPKFGLGVLGVLKSKPYTLNPIYRPPLP